MKYFFIGLAIIVFSLIIIAGYNTLLNHTDVSFDVSGIESGYLPGGRMIFKVDVKNLSRVEKSLVLGSKIQFNGSEMKFPQVVMILKSNDGKTNLYDYALPENTDDGKYCVEIDLRNKSFEKDELLGRKIYNFSVKRPVIPKVVVIPPLDARIRFKEQLVKVNIGETCKFTVVSRNTSDRAGKFNIKVKVEQPEPRNTVKNFDEDLQLVPGAEKETIFEYAALKDLPDGDLTVTAQVHAYEKEGLSGALSSAKMHIQVNDQPPKVDLKSIPLTFDEKNNIICKVFISDDREVKSASFSYLEPRADKFETRQMQLVSGSSSSGTWSYTINTRKKKGRYRYFLSATDDRNQETRTPEYSVEILKK